jgi:hypothetical protein
VYDIHKKEGYVMTDAQIFQIFGLAYVAVGIAGVTQQVSFQKLVENFTESPALLLLSGFLATVLGFLLVTFHNEWIMGWSVIITIFGWLALIKGIMILAFPGAFNGITKSIVKSQKFMRWYAVFVLLLGIFFLLLGFEVF